MQAFAFFSVLFVIYHLACILLENSINLTLHISRALSLNAFSLMFGPRKYPSPPRGGDQFSGGGGGGGVNLPNFQRGVGWAIGKFFQRVLMTHKNVAKKKHKNLP